MPRRAAALASRAIQNKPSLRVCAGGTGPLTVSVNDASIRLPVVRQKRGMGPGPPIFPQVQALVLQSKKIPQFARRPVMGDEQAIVGIDPNEMAVEKPVNCGRQGGPFWTTSGPPAATGLM